jgi:hypothetical protein
VCCWVEDGEGWTEGGGWRARAGHEVSVRVWSSEESSGMSG